MIRDEILKKIQAEGLAIVKLHDKLNELNVEHEVIDRREKSIRIETDKEMSDILSNICPFYYQIYVKEDGNRISLIQSSFSYGITENLIEVYNFIDEPITLDPELAADLIIKKKLNSYIIVANEKNEEALEILKEIKESLITRKEKI